MGKLFVLLACFALIGVLCAEDLPANLTNQSVNDTITATGGATVGVLSMNWTDALGKIISDGVNSMLGKNIVSTSIGAAVIAIVFLLLFYTKVMNIWQALGSIFGAVVLLAALYIFAHAMGMI